MWARANLRDDIHTPFSERKEAFWEMASSGSPLGARARRRQGSLAAPPRLLCWLVLHSLGLLRVMPAVARQTAGGLSGTSRNQKTLAVKRLPLVFFKDRELSGTDLRVIGLAQRCNGEVWVMTSGCNKWSNRRTWKCYDIGLSAANMSVGKLLMLHPGPPKSHPNTKAFEMASIVRWLYFMQLFKDEKLARAAFADLDVLVYSDFANLAQTHPQLARAHLALTGRNGAVSVWTRRALASFTSFVMTIASNCSSAELMKHWSVDMGIIGRWLGVQTDSPAPPAMVQPEPVVTLCKGSAIFLAPKQRLRVVNLDLASSWPVQQAFYSGNIADGASCNRLGWCPPMQMPNCSTIYMASAMLPNQLATLPLDRAVQRRTQVLVHPTHKRVRAAALWKVDTLCSPFTQDECFPELLLPFHAAHFSGRFKHFLPGGMQNLGMPVTCQCLSSSGPPTLNASSPVRVTSWRLGAVAT